MLAYTPHRYPKKGDHPELLRSTVQTADQEALKEGIANRLLAQTHAGSDKIEPAYSEEYLIRRRDQRRGYTLSITQIINDLPANDERCYWFQEMQPLEILRGVNRAHLSDRQFDILTLWRKGLTQREIADALYVSVGTVNSEIHKSILRLSQLPFWGIITVMCEVFNLRAQVIIYLLARKN